ncbi:MAG TPA: hypothetical protein VNV14_01655 [Opitutaceae bacterium]|nr:hypothetical protein [Opitutaceae bacterium]
MNSPTRPAANVLVLWVIWFALVSSIVFYQFMLGHGLLTGIDAQPASHNPIMLFAVGQIAVASLLRWLLLPKARVFHRQLIVMVIGLALSESVEIYGIFLFGPDMPSTKMTLFVVSLLSALQFAPVFAKQGNADGQNG